MAKTKSRPEKKMPPTAEVDADLELRHIQIKLAADAYDRGKRIAKANGLSMNAYVRQAVLQRIRSDSEQMEGSK